MSSPLKVIALISGGKDSLFSILHCLANGHEVVALANLHPPLPSNPSEEGEDINSYMYQTVGHSIIPLYENALGIPLYRQEILGSTINMERDYTAPSHISSDETESLIPLLKKVTEAHPEVNAISTGAILSTYQRTRVESIALRLGLTPLSYLWQYPSLPPYSQPALLYDMAAVGQDARIIKVASGGLDESFLWENVADRRTIGRLGKAVGRFGGDGDGAVLGEGGEFETLAVDGPGVLWKKRIEVDFEGGFAGEGGNAVAKWKGAKVVEKEPKGRSGLDTLRIPNLWDNEFKQVLQLPDNNPLPPLPASTTPKMPTSPMLPFPATLKSETSTTLTISNLTNPSLSPPSASTSQLTTILSTLKSLMDHYPFSSVLHATLLLRNISTFTTLNPLYSQLFTTPNPPSRVTIACGNGIPEGADIMMSVIVSKQGQRKGLHVQSSSYWAPANIGPYSQSIAAPLAPVLVEDGNGDEEKEVGDGNAKWNGEGPQVVYLAGQIPLVPASMKVVEGGFQVQAVLALQHLWRIGRAMDVGWWTVGVGYISDCEPGEAISRAGIAQAAWKTIHEVLKQEEKDDEDEDIDVWDRIHGINPRQTTSDTTIRHPLPDWDAINGVPVIPPCFIVQVWELPRNVDIEWWSIGVAKCKVSTILLTSPPSYLTSALGTRTRFIAVAIGERDVADLDLDRTLGGKVGGGVEWEHCTLYASPALPGDVLEKVRGAQWVPCKRVWVDGKELLGCLVGRVSVRDGEE
ncbi:hypothetical protein K469DRAFT_399013 [Zopfia rhizophila CBS 207.26]|uniref:Diphthine--ammonia ligase n=1 Tax=Zopfia rhizophila CBS 207.26 TaxID=1314779 RepID=A0A6A6DB82_9PEZI|nr:hypothetical protein K469DRAFT_399013 [Zopfia rhizophila CBS 207.26]